MIASSFFDPVWKTDFFSSRSLIMLFAASFQIKSTNLLFCHFKFESFVFFFFFQKKKSNLHFRVLRHQLQYFVWICLDVQLLQLILHFLFHWSYRAKSRKQWNVIPQIKEVKLRVFGQFHLQNWSMKMITNLGGKKRSNKM